MDPIKPKRSSGLRFQLPLIRCGLVAFFVVGMSALAWAESEERRVEDAEAEASDSPDTPEKAEDLEAFLDDIGRASSGTGQTGSYGQRIQRYGVLPYLNGYLGFDIERLAEERFNFDVHHFVINIGANIAERLVTEIGVEFEHGAKEMYLTLAQVDVVALRDLLILRMGLFPVPAGSFNEYGYPDFLRLSIARPAVLTYVMPTGSAPG